MANLPESMYVNPRGAGPNSSRDARNPTEIDLHSATANQLILLLREPLNRENVLLHLIKKRETCKELGLTLWNSFNTVYILLEEVLSVYKLLSSPSKLTARDSTRVCNALVLLQCMAGHPDTRMALIKAKIPVYLYPFLNTMSTERPFEHLRLTSLGVIGALVKVDDPHGPQVIHFFLETQLFPLCLRCMELGTELTQTVAIFIVSKMLMQDEGLHYCCALAVRFFEVGRVLAGVVEKLERPSPQLLKYVIRCFLRMSEMSSGCTSLRHCFPAKLTDSTFINVLREDPSTIRMLQKLCSNIMTGR